MEKYGKRLAAARKYANELTQNELIAKLKDKFGAKISQQAISYLESGDADGSEFTAQIAVICGVDSIWLATGQGDMVPDALIITDQQMKKAIYSLEKMPSELQAQQIQSLHTLVEQLKNFKLKKNGTQ